MNESVRSSKAHPDTCYAQLEVERFSIPKTVTLHAWSVEVILDFEESVLYRFTAYDKRKIPD